MFDKFIEYVSKKIIDSLWTNYSKKIKERDAELIGITDTFGSIEQLLKYYVEPNCQNINPANYDEGEPDAVVRTPVFQFLNTYLNREFIKKGDGRNQLFVLSDAGVGKTSLLLMVKLCNLLPNITWEFPIENTKRVELIKLDAEALGKVRAIENTNETILLLDALDEDPLSWQKPEKRLLKILQSSSNFNRVIISCRTQFFPEKGVRTFGTQDKISLGGYVCPMIFPSLFDERQVLEYLEKRFPKSKNPENSQKQDKALDILKKAKSLSFRPFLLSHIEDLLESEDRDWTELSVYDELVSVWIRREVRKKSISNFTENILLIACMAVAAKMQESGKRHLTKNELNKIIKNIPAVAQINHIEYGSKSLLNRNSIGEYRFSHFSIQEYFLSKYIIALSIDRNDNPVKVIPVNRSKIRLTRKSLEFLSFSIDSEWSYSESFLLENLILDGFDFSSEDWSKCSFKNSRLRDTNFKHAKVLESNFSNTDLNGALFDYSNCDQTNFQNANLANASFQNVNSEGANFNEANFYHTNLKGLSNLGKLSKKTTFVGTVMPNGKISSK